MEGRRRGAAGGVPGILRALSGSPRPGLCGHRPTAPRPSRGHPPGGRAQPSWGGGDRKGTDDAPFPVATLGPGLSDQCTTGITELQTSGWEPPAPPEHPWPAHEPQADKQPHVQEKRWQGNLGSPEASKGTGWGQGCAR